MRHSPGRGVADEATRVRVQERYGAIAVAGGCCGSGGAGSGCCGGPTSGGCCDNGKESGGLGYSKEQLASLPEGADLGLGCGNPTALLALRRGQVVLDLGSGAGIDCFLAAKKVGSKGRVIGVDMTPEMIGKARENARRGKCRNVEFRLGEIEHLPVADRSVDVILSNCVVNLAPDKASVYREAFRVLRPGGHLALSDVVATKPISKEDRENPALWSSCSSGALGVGQIGTLLRRAGFRKIQINVRGEGGPHVTSLDGPASLGVYTADIRACRPVRGGP